MAAVVWIFILAFSRSKELKKSIYGEAAAGESPHVRSPVKCLISVKNERFYSTKSLIFSVAEGSQELLKRA